MFGCLWHRVARDTWHACCCSDGIGGSTVNRAAWLDLCWLYLLAVHCVLNIKHEVVWVHTTTTRQQVIKLAKERLKMTGAAKEDADLLSPGVACGRDD